MYSTALGKEIKRQLVCHETKRGRKKNGKGKRTGKKKKREKGVNRSERMQYRGKSAFVNFSSSSTFEDSAAI